MRFEVDGRAVFAAGERGAHDDRPVIVLVHGAAMDHSVWALYTRYFRHAGRPVVALDLPGHGRSQGAPLERIEHIAAWLLRVLDALEVGEARVAGHSMGALAALDLAGSAGTRVSRLALLGAAVPMPVSDPLLAAAREAEPAARDMMMLWGHGPQARLGANPVAGVHVVNTAMRLLERAAPGVLYCDLNACNDYARGLEQAARVVAQTTLICGRDDKMTPPAAARDLADAIPHCNVELVERCGHILMTEQPEATHRRLVAALA